MSNLLILGARKLQIPSYLKACELGCNVFGVDPDPNALGFKYTKKHLVADIGNYETVKNFAKLNHIDGVVTAAADFPVKTLAKLCDDLNLKGLNYQAALNATHKHNMVSQFINYDIPCPKSHLISSFDDLLNLVPHFKESILKPCSSSGSRGVTKLNSTISKSDLMQAYQHAILHDPNKELLLQEYIHGKEYSVESITYKGRTTVKAITEKQTSGAPHFVETGHIQPPVLSPFNLQCIHNITINAIAALQLDYCCSHTEIMVTEQEVVVIEVGSRLGGDYITSHLTPLSTGEDLISQNIQMALGIPPDQVPPQPYPGAAAVQFLTSQEGTYLGFEGDIPQEIDLELYLKKGDQIKSLSNSNDRIGHLICHAPTRTEVEKKIQSFLSQFKIIVEESKK